MSAAGMDIMILFQFHRFINGMKSGETCQHTITKSELYQGKKVSCQAPFDKWNRVEYYKRAWGGEGVWVEPDINNMP